MPYSRAIKTVCPCRTICTEILETVRQFVTTVFYDDIWRIRIPGYQYRLLDAVGNASFVFRSKSDNLRLYALYIVQVLRINLASVRRYSS
jgi:hypothetical protein